jgi:phosphocarrier protein FPr
LEAARQQIREVQTRILDVTGAAEAAIFDAHLLCLEDPVLVGKTRALIFDQHMSAASAWAQAVQQVIQAYEALHDPDMRTRSADIVDVGRRVSAQLSGPTPSPQEEPSGPVILLAADLTPSDVATLNPRLVRGICTALGGPSSHAAILARAMGIPAVVGLDVDLLSLPAGIMLALDGSRGEVEIEPSAEAFEIWKRRLAEEVRFAKEAEARRLEPAITLDGHRVVMVANAGSLAEVEESFRQGAEGIGVLRTEFLFLGRDSAPGEEEQLEIYQAIFDHAGERPVVMRTLDAGGDKPLRYLERAAEANPFLGQRGLRLSLAHPELFKTQVRAFLRARAGHDLRVLLPMVSTVDEVRQAKRLINKAHGELAARGVVQGEDLPLGIMVEVPSAALLLDRFLHEIDFVSIGTNDLTQYALAADRGNPKVARLSDACHPAVLRLIRAVVEQSHAAGKLVSICGEVAADPEAQPVVVGLGADELSMAASAIPGAKALVRTISLQRCRELAEEATRMDSAEGVRELIRRNQRLSSS